MRCPRRLRHPRCPDHATIAAARHFGARSAFCEDTRGRATAVARFRERLPRLRLYRQSPRCWRPPSIEQDANVSKRTRGPLERATYCCRGGSEGDGYCPYRSALEPIRRQRPTLRSTDWPCDSRGANCRARWSADAPCRGRCGGIRTAAGVRNLRLARTGKATAAAARTFPAPPTIR